jgi:hypothetical protein
MGRFGLLALGALYCGGALVAAVAAAMIATFMAKK